MKNRRKRKEREEKDRGGEKGDGKLCKGRERM